MKGPSVAQRNFWKIMVVMAVAVCPLISHGSTVNVTPVVVEEVKKEFPGMTDMLLMNLNSALSHEGVYTQNSGTRYAVSADIVKESVHTLATAPKKVAAVVNFVLTFGDYRSGVSFAQETFRAKGVGETEDAALKNAVKNLNLRESPKLKTFILQGVSRVKSYYEENAGALLGEVDALMASGQYEEALYHLDNFPSACSYYDDVVDRMAKSYSMLNENMDFENLQMAKKIWAAARNQRGGKEAMAYLAKIPSSSKYYREAKSLSDQIDSEINRQNQHERNLEASAQKHSQAMERLDKINRQKEIESQTKLETKRIEARRDVQNTYINACKEVATAYANRYPRNIVIHRYYWRY